MSESDGDVGRQILQENMRSELTVREEVLDVLLEKIRNDRYPSTTMMDDVEQILTPWRREDYADVLLEKVRENRYPSRSMIQRLLRLSG